MGTEQTETPQFRVIGLPGIGMIERGDDLVPSSCKRSSRTD